MRVPNWDIKLAEHIDSLRDYPFVWGEHDCLTFVNKCVEVIRGQSFADDWLGEYTTGRGAFKTYRKLLYTQEYDTIIDMLDDRLERFTGRFPPRGSVVGRPCDQTIGILPVSLGVIISDLAAFLGEDGMIISTLDENDLFWSVD
jgi:hypothetical protein